MSYAFHRNPPKLCFTTNIHKHVMLLAPSFVLTSHGPNTKFRSKSYAHLSAAPIFRPIHQGVPFGLWYFSFGPTMSDFHETLHGVSKMLIERLASEVT